MLYLPWLLLHHIGLQCIGFRYMVLLVLNTFGQYPPFDVSVLFRCTVSLCFQSLHLPYLDRESAPYLDRGAAIEVNGAKFPVFLSTRAFSAFHTSWWQRFRHHKSVFNIFSHFCLIKTFSASIFLIPMNDSPTPCSQHYCCCSMFVTRVAPKLQIGHHNEPRAAIQSAFQ